MIAELLAALRDGWVIVNIERWRGQDCWRIEPPTYDAPPKFIALPSGWVKPQ